MHNGECGWKPKKPKAKVFGEPVTYDGFITTCKKEKKCLLFIRLGGNKVTFKRDPGDFWYTECKLLQV
jgi:hypothetical protein